jgi:hypothetical protein
MSRLAIIHSVIDFMCEYCEYVYRIFGCWSDEDLDFIIATPSSTEALSECATVRTITFTPTDTHFNIV